MTDVLVRRETPESCVTEESLCEGDTTGLCTQQLAASSRVRLAHPAVSCAPGPAHLFLERLLPFPLGRAALPPTPRQAAPGLQENPSNKMGCRVLALTPDFITFGAVAPPSRPVPTGCTGAGRAFQGSSNRGRD